LIPEGTVELARLDGDVLTAHWRHRQEAHEIVVEWTLALAGRPLSVWDKKTGQKTVVALHRYDEGGAISCATKRRSDGVWEIELPIAWHSMCVAVSGVIKLELDPSKFEALYSDELHVEL
jgi:hypothetical protein